MLKDKDFWMKDGAHHLMPKERVYEILLNSTSWDSGIHDMARRMAQREHSNTWQRIRSLIYYPEQDREGILTRIVKRTLRDIRLQHIQWGLIVTGTEERAPDGPDGPAGPGDPGDPGETTLIFFMCIDKKSSRKWNKMLIGKRDVLHFETIASTDFPGMIFILSVVEEPFPPVIDWENTPLPLKAYAATVEDPTTEAMITYTIDSGLGQPVTQTISGDETVVKLNGYRFHPKFQHIGLVGNPVVLADDQPLRRYLHQGETHIHLRMWPKPYLLNGYIHNRW